MEETDSNGTTLDAARATKRKLENNFMQIGPDRWNHYVSSNVVDDVIYEEGEDDENDEEDDSSVEESNNNNSHRHNAAQRATTTDLVDDDDDDDFCFHHEDQLGEDFASPPLVEQPPPLVLRAAKSNEFPPPDTDDSSVEEDKHADESAAAQVTTTTKPPVVVGAVEVAGISSKQSKKKKKKNNNVPKKQRGPENSIFALENKASTKKSVKGASNTGATTAGAVSVKGPPIMSTSASLNSDDPSLNKAFKGRVGVSLASDPDDFEDESNSSSSSRQRRTRNVRQLPTTSRAVGGDNSSMGSVSSNSKDAAVVTGYLLPNDYHAEMPSNVTVDETDTISVYTEATDHSELTQQIRNTFHGDALNDDNDTIVTTHTMATAAANNTAGRRRSGRSTSSSSTTVTATVRRNSAASNLSGRSTSPSPLLVGVESALTRPRSTVVNPLTSMIMDDQGHAMSEEEMRDLWLAEGKCGLCGQVQTHKKTKVGPFGVFRKMQPQTTEGTVYRGYCLRCYSVPELRELLNDQTIPHDLPRYNPRITNQPSLSNIHSDQGVVKRKKQTPLQALCSSWKFQTCLGLSAVAAVGGIVAAAVILSAGAAPYVSQPPTSSPTVAPSTQFPSAAPTSMQWVNTALYVPPEPVASYAYNLDFDRTGTRLLISSPHDNEDRGRVDVIEVVKSEETQGEVWVPVGNPIVGVRPGDLTGRGAKLSSDGSTLAVGSPGTSNGLVRVYRLVNNQWTQFGQTIEGPDSQSLFGHSVNMDEVGERLIVGAPGFSLSSSSSNEGMARVYNYTSAETWELDDQFVGAHAHDEMGYAVEMSAESRFIVVSAPGSDEKWMDGGKLYYFRNTGNQWVEFVKGPFVGDDIGYRVGEQLSLSYHGNVVAASAPHARRNGIDGAGMTEVFAFGPSTFNPNRAGFPIDGRFPNHELGTGLSINTRGLELALTGRNMNETTGSALAFVLISGMWFDLGDEFPGFPMGNATWFGAGPSVANNCVRRRVALGYESVMLPNGTSTPLIAIWDFDGVAANEPVLPFFRMNQTNDNSSSSGSSSSSSSTTSSGDAATTQQARLRGADKKEP